MPIYVLKNFSWILIVFSGFIISVCLYEYCRAIVASYGGDSSLRAKGYVTLNPFNYERPTLIFTIPLFAMLVQGIFLPRSAVFMNLESLRTRSWKSAVSAVSVCVTLIVTVAIALLLKFCQSTYPLLLAQASETGNLTLDNLPLEHVMVLGLIIVLMQQLLGGMINLLPIPGFDGFGIIEPWLPNNIQKLTRRLSRYSVWVLVALLVGVPTFTERLISSLQILIEFLDIPYELAALGFSFFFQARFLCLAIFLMGLFAVDYGKKLLTSNLSGANPLLEDQEIVHIDD